MPSATYRLQLNRDFTFRDAAAIVPYLSSLGISHCYVSPYMRARPGSMHGYDIIDHNALNPELGTSEDYEHFVAQLHRQGMGQILDIVPNHMGVMGSDNAWWLDVLENGEASDYAGFFDIDWDPIKDELKGKVLIPILADQYGDVLERGELKLTFDPERGEFSIFYHENRFPIDPKEYARILGFQIDRLQERLTATNDDFLELQSVVTAFSHLSERRHLDAGKRAERNREKEVQKRRLAALCARSAEIKAFLVSNVEALNGNPSDPASFDELHDIIKAQAYRLAQWRVAADDINYRRFFDVNDLAALRMENEEVFAKTHRFILELVAQAKVDGLRIDHPDGLYDPAKYLSQLREQVAAARAGEEHFYIVVEKILIGKERLRREWPVEGTTGYEFANLANGLFVDQSAERKIERIYRSFCSRSEKFGDLVYACKKLILRVVLASELNVLANLLSRIALANRHTCDFTINSLRNALFEIIASFPVYRTYVSGIQVSPEDGAYIEQAVAAARRRSNAGDLSVFDFIRRVLLVELNSDEGASYHKAVLRFAMKFQQVSAAVMAKGVEDTAFYRYGNLISLNEVGGNPGKFGSSVEEFHRANQERLNRWPHSMLSSSTHDSKRSEDVRSRIDVLSEVPAEWRLRLRRWQQLNRSKKRVVDGESAPDRNDEYFLYQTLIGTWPGGSADDAGWTQLSERIAHYVLKAAREAKEHTSWGNANPEYESALTGFTRAILSRAHKNQFLADLADFASRISRVGQINSLSECLMKMTSPGVPDIYQGNELLQFNLVDPDNRRPVDYDLRKKLLEQFQQDSPSSRALLTRVGELLANPGCGELKLYLIWKTLGLRRAEPELFRQGSYVPLNVTGQSSEHVIAYARQHENQTAIIAVPRLCASLVGSNQMLWNETAWGDTQIEIPNMEAPGCYRNLFTGECVRAGVDEKNRFPLVGSLLSGFPVALLLSQPAATMT